MSRGQPRRRTVYVGAPYSSAITRSTRAPATPKPPLPPAKDTLAPAISRVRVTHRRAQVAEAGPNRLRVMLRAGRYRARLTAVDAAGNRSAATVRFRIRRR